MDEQYAPRNATKGKIMSKTAGYNEKYEYSH